LNDLVFQVSAREEGQGKESTNRNVNRKEDEGRKIIRSDLGGGLESIAVIHFENGQVFATLKEFKRHGTVVMSYASHPTLGTGMRSYYQNGKVVMNEEFDNEGRIGMLILLDADGSPTEIFERLKDGTTLPISSERLEDIKKGGKLAKEMFGPIADAVLREDQKEAKRLISEAIEELKQDDAPPENPDP
jgi:hypothetical protein